MPQLRTDLQTPGGCNVLLGCVKKIISLLIHGENKKAKLLENALRSHIKL